MGIAGDPPAQTPAYGNCGPALRLPPPATGGRRMSASGRRQMCGASKREFPITQPHVAPSPLVAHQLPHSQPPEFPTPLSSPSSGHESPPRTAPKPKSSAPVVQPLQPPDLRSQNHSHHHPTHPNHQNPDNPDLQTCHVGLSRVLPQHPIAKPIQLLPQHHPNQQRPSNVRAGHLDVSPAARRSSRLLKNLSAARTILSLDQTQAPPRPGDAPAASGTGTSRTPGSAPDAAAYRVRTAATIAPTVPSTLSITTSNRPTIHDFRFATSALVA